MTGSCFQQSHKSDIAHIWQINPETDVIQLIHDGDTNYQLGGRCTVTRWYLMTKFLNSMSIIEESRHPLTKSDPWGSRQIIRMNHRTWCKKFPRVELEGAKPSVDRSISSDRDGGGGRWCTKQCHFWKILKMPNCPSRWSTMTTPVVIPIGTVFDFPQETIKSRDH